MPSDANPAAAPRRSRSPRGLLLSALLGGFAWLGLGSLQTWLIFPGAASQGRASAIVPENADYTRLDLRAADGTAVAALFGRARMAGDRPTVLFCYGNGNCVADCGWIFEQFRRIGAHVIIPDYEGYGMSGGRPSEAGCYAAADAAYAWLRAQPDIDQRRIFAAGWSIGSAVAIDLASRRPVAGLVAISPFTTMAAMAHRQFPWLPTALLLRSHFDNLAKIPGITCPILLAHGMRDTFIPPEMDDRLAAVAKTKVTRVHIATGTHTSVFEAEDGEIWNAISNFMEGR
jgi:pimeloyl-ACP methyl ester carboxylesterase